MHFPSGCCLKFVAGPSPRHLLISFTFLSCISPSWCLPSQYLDIIKCRRYPFNSHRTTENIQLLYNGWRLLLWACLLRQWFSNLCVNANHLEILLKCRFRFNLSWMDPRFCIFNWSLARAMISLTSLTLYKLSSPNPFWQVYSLRKGTCGIKLLESEKEIHSLPKGCI